MVGVSLHASEGISPNPSSFPELRPKEEQCCSDTNELVVGALCCHAPGRGAVASGCLGIDALVMYSERELEIG